MKPMFGVFAPAINRGGVLQDVLGLEDTFLSPWPQSLKSSKIALSSARGQHYFWTVEISLENARNLAKNLWTPFCFPHLEHKRRQGEGGRAPLLLGAGSLPIEISPKTKMSQKSLLFLQFQFLFRIFADNSITNCQYWILKTKGAGSSSIQFLPANLNVLLGENEEFLS